MATNPPLPEGFVLDSAADNPALPDGFVLDRPSRKPVDVEANRMAAVGQYIEGLPWYERFGIGVREPIARAGARVEQALGIPQTAEQKTGPLAPIPPELSAGANDITTAIGRSVPVMAALSRVPALASFPAISNAPAIVRGVAAVAPSALASAGVGALTSENPTAGAVSSAAGSVLGSGIAAGVGRIANGVVGNWANRVVQGADDIDQTLSEFQRLGGKLTPGQASGGRAAQFVDESLANNALTATPYSAIEKHNQKLLNRILLRALGIGERKSDKIGPSALQAADDVINREFNAVARKLPEVKLPEEAVNELYDLLDSRTLKPFMERLQTGAITGRDYMDIRSKVLAITRRNGSNKIDDAWNMIETLDDAAESVAPEGYKEAYAAARERFKTLKAVDTYRRAITGGDVNALTLEGAVRSIYDKQYSRAAPTMLPETSDFFTAIRAMSDPRMSALTGGSPTAKRLMPLLTAGAVGAGGYANLPATAALVGGTVLGSRAYLAAPASARVRQVGGVAGAAVGNQIARGKPDSGR